MKKDELQALIGQGVLQQEPDEELWQQELRELAAAGFLQAQPDPNTFAFNNNLTWEVVYETLLFAKRRRLHALLARHMEKFNAEQLDSVAGLLLYHYELAQVWDKSVLYGAMAGDRAAAMFANDDAVDVYQRALAALDNIHAGGVADRSLLYERLGDVYEIAGLHPQAVEALTRALELWRGPGRGRKPRRVPWTFKSSTRESELCRKIAVSCERQSDYDGSLQWLDEAAQKLPARPGRVAAQLSATRSMTLFRKGEYQEGIKWGQQALKLARRSGLLEDIAYAHNMLAASYGETGQLRKAMRHYHEAVKIYGELNDFPGIAAANSNLASYYGIMGDLDASIAHFDVALQADERMQNISGIAIDHQNLGHLLAIRGRLGDAVDHLDKVVELYKQGKCRPDLAGAAYIDLCECHCLQGDTQQAEQLLDIGLPLLRETGQTGLIMDAELQQAELWLTQNHLEPARDLCLEVLQRIRELDAKIYEVRGERVLGNALAALRDKSKALGHLKLSVNIARQIGADHEQAKSLISLAQFDLNNGGRAKPTSRKQLQRAMNTLEKMGANLELKQARKLYEQFN